MGYSMRWTGWPRIPVQPGRSCTDCQTCGDCGPAADLLVGTDPWHQCRAGISDQSFPRTTGTPDKPPAERTGLSVQFCSDPPRTPGFPTNRSTSEAPCPRHPAIARKTLLMTWIRVASGPLRGILTRPGVPYAPRVNHGTCELAAGLAPGSGAASQAGYVMRRVIW